MPQTFESRDEHELQVARFWRSVALWCVGLLVTLTTASMYGCPRYNVYSQRLAGEATLAHANAAREVLVAQARAEKEAAQLRADAIAILGAAAKQYPEYRQQEFIGAFAEALQHGNINQIIYVPTESNIPILTHPTERATVPSK